METRPLGSSGIAVHPIGLGAMPMSLQGRPDEAESVQVIWAALDAGMDLIDTADVYCLDERDIGHNERLVGRALRERGGTRDVVVATKGGLERPGGRWVTDGRPEHLQRACEDSLRALGTEAIDLYQLHAPDVDVPFADSVGALARLQEAGKVRHVGLSNVTVSQIEEACRIVDVVSVQNRCNPFFLRAFQDGVLAHCERHDIAFLAYSPVGGGRGHVRTANHPVLVEVGVESGATPYQVALAWLLAKSSAMIPIPGASKVESATSSAAALAVELSKDQMAEIDGAFS
ncbi:MAG: aldo/keto reductase [Deltaproteobacteria bacterium]|nr:aldo/keto reductase [Deltaproteobacteria bacterium]MBW2255841.1 aldo/keto reductase [Deltaproteobacteria bacterium]